MPEKNLKHLVKSYKITSHMALHARGFIYLRSSRKKTFKQIPQMFFSMVMSVKKSSLAREKLHFIDLWEKVLIV